MTDEQLDQMEKLWETMIDLLGDIMALENFCRCQDRNVVDFGTAAALAYVRRVQESIQRQIAQITQITNALSEGMLSDIFPD